MKKIVTLLMAFAMCLSMSVQSYAAQNTLSTALVQQLNQYNFSSEVNDQSAQVKKWLDINYPNSEDGSILLWLYKGHVLKDASNDHMQLITSRKVSEQWTLTGKADATLGQCYESKVDLLIGELSWYASRVTTKVWVKSEKGMDKVTKVAYEVSSRSAEDSDTNFRMLHDSEMNNNGYFYLYDWIGEAFQYRVPLLDSDAGIKITPADYFGFITDSDYYGGIDGSIYRDGTPVVLGEISTDENFQFGIEGNVYGLDRDADFTVTLLDPETGKEVAFDNGYNLKAGKKYDLVFISEGKPLSEFRNTLFFHFNFSASKN